MSGGYDIAVVGATGVVGETFLQLLAERHFPVNKLYPLASERSKGNTVTFSGRAQIVNDVALFDFSNVQLAFFSAGDTCSAQFAARAADAGCLVIDNTSHFRYDDNVPLVVPEVNPQLLETYPRCGIIANPNCSTIQLVVALKPLADAVGINRVNVVTYQSVSGMGRSGIETLAVQTANALNGQPNENSVFSAPMAFNVIPWIDDLQPNGYTKEEMKMIREIKKILGDDTVEVNATAVRVPVFYGHCAAVHVETKTTISCKAARELLEQAPGVVFIDEDSVKPSPLTPVTHLSGADAVYVGRLRKDISHPRGLNLWVVADNVRKGAALNAIQIAELLLSYQVINKKN